MFLFNVTYPLRCLRVPQVEYHWYNRPCLGFAVAAIGPHRGEVGDDDGFGLTIVTAR
jgi:hypothetical protein